MDTSTLRTSTKLAGFAASLRGRRSASASGLGAAVGPDVTRADDEAPPRSARGSPRPPRATASCPSRPARRRRRPLPLRDRGPGRRRRSRRYTEVHERDLHLILVNRELTVFHHVHPTLDADGTWTIDLPALDARLLPRRRRLPGRRRPRLALGTDLSVAGTYRPERARRARPSQSDVDGYDVTLATERRRRERRPPTLTVRRDGDPVDLEPYLGAQGHLVAMRTGDLAYAHVHPVDDDDDAHGRGRHVRGRAALRRPLRRCSSTSSTTATVHTASFTFDQGQVTGTRRDGALIPMTDTTHLRATDHAGHARHRRHDLRVLRGPDHEAPEQARRRRRQRELRHRAGHRDPARRHRRRRRSSPRSRPSATAAKDPAAAGPHHRRRRRRRPRTPPIRRLDALRNRLIVAAVLGIPVLVLSMVNTLPVRRTGSGSPSPWPRPSSCGRRGRSTGRRG